MWFSSGRRRFPVLRPLSTVGLSLILACTAVVAAEEKEEEEKNWLVQAGTLVSYRDNFFFRADDPDNPPPSTSLTTFYANGEIELDAGKGKWTLGGEGSGTLVHDIEDADYESLTLEAEYKRNKTRGSVELAYLPNRIFSEEADGVFFDLTTLTLGIRQFFKPGFWAGLEYSLDDWSFDPDESARNATSHELGAAFRFPIARRAGIRTFAMIMRKDAESPDYDWDGYGFGLALEWSASERVAVFARVRMRDRDYSNAPPTDNNFQRSDTILDGLVNVSWRIGKIWGLQFTGRHKDGESTRPDRNYTASEAGAGLFFIF